MISTGGYSLDWPTATSTTAEVDLTALVETYAALLFRVAHSVVRSRSEAEDIVQDTFLRVLQHQRSLPEVRDLRVWLVRIAWNLALDRQRRIRPDQIDPEFAASLVAPGLAADAALEAGHRVQAMLRELDRLPKLERQAMLLSAQQELSAAEIAIILKRSESAVRALLFRARTRLRERLTKGGFA
jgi:RNA polymerase sigma-70 factor (ECF subfamily)